MVLGLLAVVEAATACQCGDKPTGWEAVAFSEVVARGTLASVRRTVVSAGEVRGDTAAGPFPFYPVDELTFEVKAVWKGNPGPQLVLWQVWCCVCEYGPFQVGGDYLIYATHHMALPNLLMTSFCFPTKPASRAPNDLCELGPPLAVPTPRHDAGSVMYKASGVAKAALAHSLDWVFSHHRKGATPSEVFAEWIVLLASPLALCAFALGVLWRLYRSH
jgi:hypothetical protein